MAQQRVFCTQGNKADLFECLSEIVHKKDQYTDNVVMKKTDERWKYDDMSSFVDEDDSAS